MPPPSEDDVVRSILLAPLSDMERKLLEVVADPLVRGTHTWPTWNYVDLTFRRQTGQEAGPIAAGLPWLEMAGSRYGYYRLLWFRDEHGRAVVQPGAAPGKPSVRVGLTVAGMYHLSNDARAAQTAPQSVTDVFMSEYVVTLRTLVRNLHEAAPDPGGVVDVSLSFDFAEQAFEMLSSRVKFRLVGLDARGLFHDLVMNEPATSIQPGSEGEWRITSVLPLAELGTSGDPTDYIERLSAMFEVQRPGVRAHGPFDLTDALGRLDLVFRSVTRRHLWDSYPIDTVGRLNNEPRSIVDYRNQLVALTTLLELMKVPVLSGGNTGAKSLNRLRAWCEAYVDEDRHDEVATAIEDLRSVPNLRHGIAHAEAERTRRAARRLGLPLHVTNYPDAWDRIVSTVIAAMRSLGPHHRG
jgi:hypothetical protein